MYGLNKETCAHVPNACGTNHTFEACADKLTIFNNAFHGWVVTIRPEVSDIGSIGLCFAFSGESWVVRDVIVLIGKVSTLACSGVVGCKVGLKNTMNGRNISWHLFPVVYD